MADKEITIKITANTDDVDKKVEATAKNLEKMSTAGSGKASDELDKVAESADKASSETERLTTAWNDYSQKVKDAEAAVRSLNATQFENAEQRDEAINSLGDKLDDLVIEGKQLEDSVKAIGVSPDSLQGFSSIVNILERANSEFQIALNNRDKLLNQPTAPEGALITADPWGDGPNGPGGPDEFAAMYQGLRDELSGYRQEMENAIAAFDRLKDALNAEYAALDRNSAGYIEQEKHLRNLINTANSQSISAESQRQQIVKNIETLDDFNEEAKKTENWDESIKGLDEYGNKVILTGQKVVKTRQQMQNVQTTYENAVIASQNKEIKANEKILAQMEMAGKSREELIRLVEQYNKAMSSAATKEEFEAAKASMMAARKQLTLVTREATLTGASILGAQTSVQGLATAIGRLGVTGRLTFAGLTNGIKMFAKSTLVLAGIQFAWEALNTIYEKVKGNLFGVADAEEAAAERAEKLAAAAKEAADNLASAQKAIRESRADQARADAAKEYADAIAQQNEHLKEQLNLIERNTSAVLFQQTLTAKEEEQKIAIEKEKLHREKILGLIDEYEYERRILELNEKAVELRAKSKVDAATAKRDAATQRVKVERQNLEEIEGTAIEELGATPEELAVQIAKFEKNEAKIQKHEDKYKEREAAKQRLQSFKTLLKNQEETGGYIDVGLYEKIAEEEENLKELNEVLSEVDNLIAQNEVLFNTLPQQIQDAQSLGEGLAEYTKDYKDRVKYNEDIEKQRKEALKRVKEAEAAELEASEALTQEYQSYSQITTQTAELNREKNATLKAKEEIAKADAEHTKKLEVVRAKARELELTELKQRMNEAKAEASLLNEATPEGKRKADIAAVYSQEIEQRKKAGDAAAKRVGFGLDGASGKAASVVRKAENLASRAGSGQNVALEKISKLLDEAAKTKGDEDNVAVTRLYDVVAKQIVITTANAKEMRRLSARAEAMKKQLASLL